MEGALPCIEYVWVDQNQTETFYILAVCLILTIVLNIGLAAIIWKRCSNAETYQPQNMVMYGAGFSSVMASTGALVYLEMIHIKDGCKHSDDIAYFAVFPGLIIRELLTACFAINRYAVCVYGLTYHLKMDTKKMGVTMFVLCATLYTGLLVIHQVNRYADHNVLVSSTVPFRVAWATCEIAVTILLCFFNLLLYVLAKSKARRSRRVMPMGNATTDQERHDLFVQNVKRISGTIFVSLFYSIRMLPNATILIVSLNASQPSVYTASRIAILLKFTLGMMDPIVQCLSIKMIKEGVSAEWASIRSTLMSIF